MPFLKKIKKQCAARTHHPHVVRGSFCSRAAMEDSKFCRQHDPMYIEARAKKRQENENARAESANRLRLQIRRQTWRNEATSKQCHVCGAKKGSACGTDPTGENMTMVPFIHLDRMKD